MHSNATSQSAALSSARREPLGYRPEIDGLRAIAVLSVIIYHADLTFLGASVLSGGFLGVDIFFVISGFLITSIIVRELDAAGSFSFANFYERRARRILPALFTVMLASLPFAWALMTPSALYEYSGSGLSSLFFGSNFWFWQENTYTAEISQLKPFLHTWTLSVEEQFYVFFPIVMILAWTYFKRRAFMFLFGLGVLSLVLAEYGSFKFADAAFYLLPTRGWELLAGALLAFLPPAASGSSSGIDRFSGAVPIVGLGMILGAIVTFNETMRHPSFATVIPITGTVLLIRFTGQKDWITRLLSTRVCVAIGLISYSLYLWHFPVFALARLGELPLTVFSKFMLIALSCALAAATYYFVEQPFRHKRTMSFWPFSLIIGATFFTLTVAFGAIYTGKALPEKYAKALNLVDFSYAYQPIFREGTCFLAPKDMAPFAGSDMSAGEAPFERCDVAQENAGAPTLYLWGDSHAAHLFSGYNALLGRQFKIEQRTASACPPVFGLEVGYRPGCKEINDSVFEEILRVKPDRVVVTAYWGPGSPEMMRETLEALRAGGIAQIEIVGPVPRWQTSLPVLLSERMSAGEEFPVYLTEGLVAEPFVVDREWREFAEREGYIIHSPIEILCRNESCLTRVEAGPEGIVQWDTAHLTEAGSGYVVARFGSK